tara:strand:- start:569 stop:934 length:366 start_codon:yes stop_codon:yes gene_type:complete
MTKINDWTLEEDEAFNEIEKLSKVKQVLIKSMKKKGDNNMKCPKCNAWSRVLETRMKKDGTKRRAIECANLHRFSTIESFATPKPAKEFMSLTSDEWDYYAAHVDPGQLNDILACLEERNI